MASVAPVQIPTRVLVYGMRHADGTVVASELAEVAESCGQSAEQVRSCLRRLVAEGQFVRIGQGRGARYELTEAGARDLELRRAGTRLAYLQDAGRRAWDGWWHLVGFAVPESRRAARDRLRERLTGVGGAALQGGLYLSPHPWESWVREEAKLVDLPGQLTLARCDELDIAGVTDPMEIADLLWPLEEIATRYRRFIETYRHLPDELESRRKRGEALAEREFLRLTLEIGVGFAECAANDPYLPPELLPRSWPGPVARDLFVRARRMALRTREREEHHALFRLLDELLENLDVA